MHVHVTTSRGKIVLKDVISVEVVNPIDPAVIHNQRNGLCTRQWEALHYLRTHDSPEGVWLTTYVDSYLRRGIYLADSTAWGNMRRLTELGYARKVGPARWRAI